MTRRIAVLVLVIVAFGALTLKAQTGCQPLVVNDLSFGTYTGTVISTSTPGVVTCNRNQNWTIGFNAGLGAGATETNRKLTGPSGATLNYQIFRDSAYTQNWGDTEGVDTMSGTGSKSITVYARLAANQVAAPGTYTDTVSSATTTFTLTAVIQATCSITATALAFGNYSGTALTSNATVTVTCTNTTPFDIGLNAGSASGATVTSRKMTGPLSATLSYSLFRDSALTQNWGNTVGTDTLHATGNGTGTPYTVYGQIPAKLFATPGVYNDTVVATVTY